MTIRKEPAWFARWLAEQRAEEEDAHCDSLVPTERMALSTFIEKARAPFLSAMKDDLLAKRQRYEDELRAAIAAAHDAGVPWIRNDPPLPRWDRFYHLQLDPRDAARWLLSNPMYQHLIHPDWARVVLKGASTQPDATVMAAPTVTPRRRRGPKPTERNRVLGLMRHVPFEKVDAMQEKEMEATYGASRFTCRAARELRRLELRQNTISDK